MNQSFFLSLLYPRGNLLIFKDTCLLLPSGWHVACFFMNIFETTAMVVLRSVERLEQGGGKKSPKDMKQNVLWHKSFCILFLHSWLLPLFGWNFVFFCLFVFSPRCIFRTFRCTTTQQRTSPFTRHAIVMNVYGTWEKSNKRQSAHTKRVWILSTSSVNMWAQKSCKFTPKLSIVWQWQTTEAASRSWFYWITWV